MLMHQAFESTLSLADRRAFTYSVLFFLSVLLLLSVSSKTSKSVKDFDTLRVKGQPQVVFKTQLAFQSGQNEKFDQPWIIPTVKIIDNIDYFEEHKNERFVLGNFTYSKGLGNLLFQYASLRGIARSNRAKVVVPDDILLRKAFLLDAIVVSRNMLDLLMARISKTAKIIQDCCVFKELEGLFSTSNLELINGYLQNPRYFGDDTRENTSFVPAVVEKAESFVRDTKLTRMLTRAVEVQSSQEYPGDITMNIDENDVNEDVHIVGIHVRHGSDITMHQRNRKHVHLGHIEAPRTFYENAMALVSKTNPNSTIFIVCTDDLHWAKKNIVEKQKGTVYFCPGHNREVDLAILSLTDELIISTGTFSWWAGFLNQKQKVFYYAKWPAEGSEMAKMIKKNDFFPEQWTALE